MARPHDDDFEPEHEHLLDDGSLPDDGEACDDNLDVDLEEADSFLDENDDD